MNMIEFEDCGLFEYSIEAIEREIIYRYKSARCYESDDDYLLALRRSIINKNVLAHQKDFLPDIIAFNDALPIQGGDRQELWYALCDEDLNPIYADGASVLTLTFPRDEVESFDSFIGMDCPPPNWNEGLDRELTKDLHLISQFHKLFQHMNFALTDFIYVRKFYSEINVNIIKGLQDHV